MVGLGWAALRGRRWRANLHPAEWDLSRQPDWTVRQIAEHVASTWYADQIGDLTATRESRRLGGQAPDDAVDAQGMGQ